MGHVFVILILLVPVFFMEGCTSIPSTKACQSVKYERNGLDYHVEADCRVQVTDAIPVPGPGL
jgi:hypothetical protein